MSIQTKIERIRRKPEYIRMRYAWSMTAVCMVFVLAIWGVSLSVQKKNFQKNTLGFDSETLETLSDQKDALTGTAQNIKGTLDQAKNMETSGTDSYQKMLESTYNQSISEDEETNEDFTDLQKTDLKSENINNIPSANNSQAPPATGNLTTPPSKTPEATPSVIPPNSTPLAQ